MHIAVVMASPELFPAAGRTGASLLHEAHRRGHKVWCLSPDAIGEEDGRLVGHAYDVDFPITSDLATFWRRLQVRVASRPPELLALDGLDALLWRKDPPLHREAVERLARLADAIPCLNDPRALLLWASKARALERFRHLMPPSAVAATPAELQEAASEIPGSLVVKPLEESGGRGVIRVLAAERSRLEHLVAAEPTLARSLASGPGLLVQKEVDGSQAGDVRILCLDGRVLGAMRRIPPSGEFRANVSVGARVAPVELSTLARARWEAVACQLAEEGLALVGLDVIGPWLIEVNAVSPAGIPRINAMLGRRLERKVLAWLERRVEAS